MGTNSIGLAEAEPEKFPGVVNQFKVRNLYLMFILLQNCRLKKLLKKYN